MGDTTFYFEFAEPGNQYSPGVYYTINRLAIAPFDLATRVWRQGPKGGVKILKEDWTKERFFGHRYVTKNEEAMREFMWLKLKARPFK